MVSEFQPPVKDKAVAVYRETARQLKLYPKVVSVRVEYSNGKQYQWWIPFPMPHLAKEYAEYLRSSR